jgi:hypothetical protein
LIEEAKTECAFWKSIVGPATQPLFGQIAREKTVPTSTYIITVFVGSGEDKYSQESVGLFESLKIYRNIEARYREFGDGTGRCRKWEDPKTKMAKMLRALREQNKSGNRQ